MVGAVILCIDVKGSCVEVKVDGGRGGDVSRDTGIRGRGDVDGRGLEGMELCVTLN